MVQVMMDRFSIHAFQCKPLSGRPPVRTPYRQGRPAQRSKIFAVERKNCIIAQLFRSTAWQMLT